MVLCLLLFLAVNFDWSIILIKKSFGASLHISGKLVVKLAIFTRYCLSCFPWLRLTNQWQIICFLKCAYMNQKGTLVGDLHNDSPWSIR